MLSLALAFAPVAHAVAMVDAHVTESAKSLKADADTSTPVTASGETIAR